MELQILKIWIPQPIFCGNCSIFYQERCDRDIKPLEGHLRQANSAANLIPTTEAKLHLDGNIQLLTL